MPNYQSARIDWLGIGWVVHVIRTELYAAGKEAETEKLSMLKSQYVLNERWVVKIMKQELKQVPYGEPSFAYLRGAGYAYVDKTHFIQVLEQCGTRFPFIVRPRRFGKSLFANMLMAYYDKAAAGDFDERFSGTWIGDHPTPWASKFLVLKLDFSGIEGGDGLIDNFIIKVKFGLRNFVTRYLPEDPQMQELLDASWTSPAALLTSFFSLVGRKLRDEIYLIIDEYDLVAQEFFSTDPERFRAMTGALGFLKTFYAAIKSHATCGCVKRTFITGVTSISLDSMTSGFNLATNITHDAEFVGMMGFTDEELRRLIPQIVDLDRYGHSVDEIIDRMKVLYDGYRFCPESDVTVLNSSMCLYYLSEIARRNAEPPVLLDPSFSIDLSKIEGILSLGRPDFVDEVVLDVLFNRHIAIGTLSGAINLNASAELTSDDVLTALVFMGFLTFSSEAPDYLVCPNLAVKDVFFKYWFRRIGKNDDLTFPPTELKKAIDSLKNGDPESLMNYVGNRLNRCVGGHVHAHINETAIQLAVCMALSTEGDYLVSAEEEALGAGYTDLILRPASSHLDAAGWVIEFKYLKKSEATPNLVEAKIAEASRQLKRYSKASNIESISNLRLAAAVFAGTELKACRVL